MDLQQEVIKFGGQAVRHYREVPVISSEAKIPEGCLSLFIASELIKRRGWKARVEVPYTEVLSSLGVFGADLAHGFGGQRADIAVFRDLKPPIVIKSKIIDEGRRVSGVKRDHDKIRRLIQRAVSSEADTALEGYVGVLVCDIYRGAKATCAERTVDELRVALGTPEVNAGEKVRAKSGEWGWMFVCAKVV